MNWSDYKKNQKTDIIKMKKAIENGYTIIRILQYDVYNDVKKWKEKLLENIYYYEKPQIIYLDEHKYSDHKELYNTADYQL